VNSGIYLLTIQDGQCSFSDSLLIDFTNWPTNLEFPNVFSQNGDLLDEQFLPSTKIGIPSFTVTILNSWGVEMHTGNGLSGWNGKRNGASFY
jgi:hypothetical protein